MCISLPKEAIQELQNLFEKRFGISLSEQEVNDEADELIKLYSLSRGKNIY